MPRSSPPHGRHSVLRSVLRRTLPFVLTVFVALLAFGGATRPLAAQSAQLDQWAVRGVTLVDGRGGPPLADAVVIVDRGRIRCAGTATRCPLWGVPSVIDGTGLWVAPGLMDTHTHLDWAADSAAAQEAQLVRFSFGITTVREAGSHDVAADLRARARAASGDRPEPRLVVAGELSSANLGILGASDYPSLADTLIRRGVDQLKIKIRLEPADLDLIFASARRRRIPIFGHGWEGPPPRPFVDDLLRRRLSGLSHLDAFSAEATRGVDSIPEAPDPESELDEWWSWRKSLWLFADSAALERMIDSMVVAGTYLEPTLGMERYWGATPALPQRVRFLGEPPRLLDLIPFRDAADERARRRAVEWSAEAFPPMSGFVRRFHEAGGALAAGSDDLPPGIGLRTELELLEQAGVPAARLVTTATSDAARILGVSAAFGTIEQGKVADLLLLEADPTASVAGYDRIWRVVKGGVVYDPDVLLEPLRLRYERRLGEAWRARTRRYIPPFLILLVVLGVGVAWWQYRRRW